jgi:DNA-binding LacI/PurR family transcriptional regulator
MLISSHENEPLIGELLEREVPTVACGIPLGYADRVTSVSVDEVGGARTMVRHLRSRGRVRIGIITGPLDTPGGRYRLEGYRQELGEAFDERLVAHGDYSAASGSAAMAELLSRVPDLDAVFAASDLMASGALVTLRKAGRKVPDDVAVAGFDDSGLAATLDPPLTTMHQPFDRISTEMVTLLLDLVDGAPHRSVTLPAELVVREST